MSTAHIIGAGLAGLSAALHLTEAGFRAVLYEAAGHAGGRCRSFFDETLETTIDNGNHLLLSGNRSAMAFLDRIGARDSLAGPAEAAFPFLDLASGARWTVRPNRGPIPWWIFARDRRVAGTTAADYLGSLRLFFAGQATVAQCFPAAGAVFRRFWDPLTVAVLNAPPDVAAARLMVPVLLETFARGADACRPLIARDGLSESLVTPAVRWLTAHGADIRFAQRCSGLEIAEERVTGLAFSRGTETVRADDWVVMAVPPAGAEALLPDLMVPQGSFPIVNVHYRLAEPVASPGAPELLGLVNGVAHWLFLRGTIASVTISAAEAVAQWSANDIGAAVWRDVARALGRDAADVPPHRVVKERRATFAQTPSELARRPQAETRYANLVLAGDWTGTGLPATIEGAIRSGGRAAEAVLRRAAGRSVHFPASISQKGPERMERAGAARGV